MIEVALKNRKPNEKKLKAFGFEKRDAQYVCRWDIVDGQMRMTVVVSHEGKVFAEVVDKFTEEEYVLHRVAAAEGAFVGRVRAEYDATLGGIFENCFDTEVFQSEQAKRLVAYAREKYGDELEFLWQKFPDNAVLRRKDNRKWYAAVLTVSRRKIGFDSDESVEIVDLRMTPQDMERAVDNVRFFPGYHMNKKHWLTICLDGTLTDGELFLRLDESYRLAARP